MLTATKAGRYEILGELGRGAMGVVYRAKDPLIGRIVAVKTIRLSEEGTGISHAELVERFQTEARAAGLLAHPNIVVVYDAGETDGVCYITMELVNGKSLQSMLDSGQKFLLPRILHIMEQVCSALQFAHDHGVVHRDIKPANIMLTSDDLVKVTDFGTAKILQYGAQHQSAATGTPSYMSPEQIKGKGVDGRTDVFALGVILYEMSTGQKPFRGQDIATILYHILNEDPVAPQKLNPNIPMGVSSTILKALAKSPHLRYENCRELLDDLKNYRPGENSVPTNTAPPLSRTPSRPPNREVKERNFDAAMPQIPGVEPRRTPAPPRARPLPPSSDAPAGNNRVETAQQGGGVYTEPAAKPNASIKRYVMISAGAVLLAMVASFGVKLIGRNYLNSESVLTHENAAPPAQPSSPEVATPPKPIYVAETNPQIASLGELAQPWSSKRFFFRNVAASKYVPALIVRLPGPASQSSSYWAFSLEVPFDRCQFEYVDDLGKLSSDYNFQAAHPMVVNPCSQTVFDPLQLKQIPGNIFVRGAIVHGYDPRPPYGIELKIVGNQIRALAME